MLHSSSGGSTRSVKDSQALLAVSVDLAVECFTRLFSGAIEHLESVQSGSQPSPLANGSITTAVDLSASVWLGEQGTRLIAGFHDDLQEQARAFREGVQSASASTSAAVTLASLEQLGFDETEALVTLRSLAQWIESLSHEEFYLFNHRFGYLCGEFALPPSRNPFGPGRVLESFDRAGKRLAGYQDARISLLKLLRRAGLEGAVPVYATLNQFLLERGVLPRFRPRMRRDIQEQDARMRAIGSATEALEQFRRGLAELATAAHRRVDPDYRSPEEIAAQEAKEREQGIVEAEPVESAAVRMVARPRADWRAAAANDRLRPAARGPRRAEESVLDAVRASGVTSRIGRVSAATLQITNFAFDQLLVTPLLATPVRLLLGRLQLPFYRAALVDRTVMSARPHPVRMLVNRLAEAGIAWSPELGEQDALYLAMSLAVERLQRPARDPIDVFARELGQFEQFLARETEAARESAAARARELYRGERNRVAYATAATEVDRALHEEIYPPLPEFAERFVRNTWTHTLRDAYVRAGREGEAWQANLDFLHELTWSLKPKPTESERRILLRMLPELVARIQAAVQQAHADKDLHEFLAELMQAHLHLVRTGTLPRSLRGGGTQVALRERIDYLALLGKLDPNLAHRAQPPPIPVGAWVELGSATTTRFRKKLVWVSPLSHRALFTNRRGEGELVLNPLEVQQALASGQLTPLAIAPLFETAMRAAKLALGRGFRSLAAPELPAGSDAPSTERGS